MRPRTFGSAAENPKWGVAFLEGSVYFLQKISTKKTSDQKICPKTRIVAIKNDDKRKVIIM